MGASEAAIEKPRTAAPLGSEGEGYTRAPPERQGLPNGCAAAGVPCGMVAEKSGKTVGH